MVSILRSLKSATGLMSLRSGRSSIAVAVPGGLRLVPEGQVTKLETPAACLPVQAGSRVFVEWTPGDVLFQGSVGKVKERRSAVLGADRAVAS